MWCSICILHPKYSLLLVLLLIIQGLSGCITNTDQTSEATVTNEVNVSDSLTLPDWDDNEYHDYYATTLLLQQYNQEYAQYVDVFSMGESVQGNIIWCIRLTNENTIQQKSSCLIDGGIHGNEWESTDACLYLIDYILINSKKNSSVQHMLNISEIYIVPLLNPDGRQNNERWNKNGVDLNRNFDCFFGKIRGRCLRLGKPLGRFVIPYVRFPRLGLWFSNAGRHAFSEPESVALADIMKTLSSKDFAFYVNCHTAVHVLGAAWQTYKPPFPMTQQEKNVIESVFSWVEQNTEYSVVREQMKTGGLAADWCFQEFHVPSFIFEILSQDYEPFLGTGKHDHLVHWMKTTLPVFMFLLRNIDNLRKWDAPTLEPVLPDGIPPEPLR